MLRTKITHLETIIIHQTNMIETAGYVIGESDKQKKEDEFVDDDELKKLEKIEEDLLTEKLPQRALEIFRSSKNILR